MVHKTTKRDLVIMAAWLFLVLKRRGSGRWNFPARHAAMADACGVLVSDMHDGEWLFAGPGQS